MMQFAALLLALVGPPVVTANSPSSGSTVGAPQMIVTVTFDQPMSPGSINGQTFTLFNQNGAIPGQIFYSKTENKAVFLPDGALAANSAFIAQIAGVESVDGVLMSSHFSWRFYTSPSSGLPNLALPSLGIWNVAGPQSGYFGWYPKPTSQGLIHVPGISPTEAPAADLPPKIGTPLPPI